MSIFKGYLKARYHLIGVLLALFILLFPADKAHAAGFTHKHTQNCYSKQWVKCDNHRTYTIKGISSYHCFNCQCIRDFRETAYWSVCNNSGKNGYPVYGDVDKWYYQECTVCGETRREESPGYYSHDVLIDALSCGFTESSTAATVSLSASTVAWTKDPVTLTVNTSISDPSFSFAGAPFDFGSGATGSNSTTVSSNGTYSVTVRSADGRSVTERITVSNIDTTAPSVNLSRNTEDWCETGITVLVDASDGESGLADAPYSYNGGAFTSSREFTVTENGDVHVSVKDKVGNITEKTIAVTKVGRDPAVVAAEKAAAEKARQEKEAAEKAAAEKARLEKEAADKAARDKAEAERIAAERAEAARIEAERAEAARIEAERAAAEEKAALEKAEADKNAKKKAEADKKAKKKAEADKKAKEKAEKEAAEKARLEAEKAEQERLEAEQAEAKRLEAERLEAERAEAEKFEAERLATETAEAAESAGGVIDTSVQNTDKALNDLLLSDNSEQDEKGLTTLLMSAGNTPLYAGLLMLLLSGVFFSFFNYVYVSSDGRKRPVAIARIKYDKSKVLVVIKKDSLSSHGKYLIYLSPWVKLLAGKRPIYGKFTDEKTLPFPLEGGRAFTY